MNIHFFSQNLVLKSKTKNYILKKLRRTIKNAGKEIRNIREIRIDLSYSPQHKPSQKVRVEVNVDLYPDQKILRAVQRAEDIEKGIDLIQDKLEKQIERIKE